MEKVKLFRFGEPFETDATVVDLRPEEEYSVLLDKFDLLQSDSKYFMKYSMKKEDIVMGFGETVKGLNKRGSKIKSFCTDDSKHLPDKKSLYGAHNFFIITGTFNLGIFIDFPGEITYDIGFEKYNQFNIDIEGKNFDFYLIEGETPKEITETFMTIIGQSYIPPKWAFGYQQSRWSYMDKEKIIGIGKNFIEKNIPCDAIYLDIDYMENFKDFTVDNDKFSCFSDFVSEMGNMGIRLVPIIDAGVKIEKGYDIYEEGIENGYFCVDKNQNPFVAAVWPGHVHFPDFINPECRKWFGLKYKYLTDMGIDGFWNDMNEPAIFYTENTISNLFEKIDNLKGKELNIYSFFDLMESFEKVPNNYEDYKSLYHRIDGKLISNKNLHNLYGYNMTRAAGEGLEKIDSNKRFLLFSRASYIGMHRYSGIWMGDNHSWWEHLLLGIKMLPAINMCGFLYSGPDTGGFGGDCNSELLIRWNQFSLFAPLYRNHSALGTRDQEPFAYDFGTEKIVKDIIKLRYSLIPYIYSEYMKSALNGKVYCSYLMFGYDDERSKNIEDQLLIGDSIMIAPIYKENSKGRYVYLPEDMIYWNGKTSDCKKYMFLEKGDHYIDVGLDETPIFIRKNKILALGESAQNVELLNKKEVSFMVFSESFAQYKLYDDDGMTRNYDEEGRFGLNLSVENKSDRFVLKLDRGDQSEVEKINIDIIDGYSILNIILGKEDFSKNKEIIIFKEELVG